MCGRSGDSDSMKTRITRAAVAAGARAARDQASDSSTLIGSAAARRHRHGSPGGGSRWLSVSRDHGHVESYRAVSYRPGELKLESPGIMPVPRMRRSRH